MHTPSPHNNKGQKCGNTGSPCLDKPVFGQGEEGVQQTSAFMGTHTLRTFVAGSQRPSRALGTCFAEKLVRRFVPPICWDFFANLGGGDCCCGPFAYAWGVFQSDFSHLPSAGVHKEGYARVLLLPLNHTNHIFSPCVLRLVFSGSGCSSGGLSVLNVQLSWPVPEQTLRLTLTLRAALVPSTRLRLGL